MRMPLELRTEMWNSIDNRLKSYMQGREDPSEIATTFNYILYDEFGKDRGVNGFKFNFNPEFVGEYILDQKVPTQTRVYSHHGTEACSPIPIKHGIIGRSIRTGQDQYIPDVRKDTSHIACSDEMEHGGTEIVLLSWSEPYSTGDYKNLKVPLGVLDIDLKVTDAFSQDDITRLKRVWKPYGKLIFPGEPEFEITPQLEDIYQFIPKEKKRKKSA
jgi:putative methionine-R-sulfoxide reductase with GAF domain